MSNPQNPPLFSLKSVSFRYEDATPALQELTFDIQPGEKVAFLGSNGSGKSTLLKLLDGLEFASTGEIAYYGRMICEENLRDDNFNFEFRKNVGFVFQESDAQLFLPSVEEELAFAPLQMDLATEEVIRRVDQALADLQIEGLRKRAPHQLSGGEKKKVALASILTLEPDVWLFDEPTTGLDPRTVRWLVTFIESQANQGKTILLATHDLDLAARLTTRVCVLDENHRLIRDDETKRVLADKRLLEKTNLI